MERVNLLCEIENCGNAAHIFGLKGNLKTRSCRNHMTALVDKRMQMFGIEGYYFISNTQDAVLFEERRTLVEKGRGNLTVLEANCESELATALQAIDSAKRNVLKSVEHRFEEMKVAVTTTCYEAKRQLSMLKSALEQFLASKESQLPPTALLICSNLSITPKIVRFGIADSSDSISAVLSDSWIVATVDIYSSLKCLDAAKKKEAISDALKEAIEQARKGIPTALQYLNSLIGDNELFSEDEKIVLSELLKVEKSRIERNLKWLKCSWDLKQRFVFSDEMNVEVGQKLAILLYRQHGRFAEAEQILRYCYDIAQRQSPLSELSIALCNDICGVYLASAQYQQLDQLASWILENCSSDYLSAEHLWTTIFYRVYSMRLQEKDSEANEIHERWKWALPRENALAEMLRLLNWSINAHFNDRKEEAKRLLFQVRQIGISTFPTSPFTALAFLRITLLFEGKLQEQNHRDAQSIFEVAAPKSMQSAVNIMNFGLLHREMKRWSEAESSYRQAQSIYEVAGPQSMNAARNFMNLGNLYEGMKRWREAESNYRQAQSIYEVAGPQSVDAGNNYWNMGLLFEEMKQTARAVECYQMASLIYAECEDITMKLKAEEKTAFLVKR